MIPVDAFQKLHLYGSYAFSRLTLFTSLHQKQGLQYAATANIKIPNPLIVQTHKDPYILCRVNRSIWLFFIPIAADRSLFGTLIFILSNPNPVKSDFKVVSYHTRLKLCLFVACLPMLHLLSPRWR